ncbi:MAG: CYTH domain-containing protein [Pseudomonadota bacterium]
MISKDDTTLELEQKLELAPADLETVFESFKPAQVKTKSHIRDYYDTPALDLYRDKTALRLEYKEGIGYEQTLKTAVSEGDTAGQTLQRHEWEYPVKNNAPDFSVITDARALAAVSKVKAEDLIHLFTSKINRRCFDMTVDLPEGQAVVEIAFDLGQIILAPDYQQNESITCHELSEIEVERISGPVRAIDQVIEQIQTQMPRARLSQISKNQRGIALFQAAA